MNPLSGKEGCTATCWEVEECRRWSEPRKCGKYIKYRVERALGMRKRTVSHPQEFMKQQSRKAGTRQMSSVQPAPSKLLNPDKSPICGVWYYSR